MVFSLSTCEQRECRHTLNELHPALLAAYIHYDTFRRSDQKKVRAKTKSLKFFPANVLRRILSVRTDEMDELQGLQEFVVLIAKVPPCNRYCRLSRSDLCIRINRYRSGVQNDAPGNRFTTR